LLENEPVITQVIHCTIGAGLRRPSQNYFLAVDKYVIIELLAKFIA